MDIIKSRILSGHGELVHGISTKAGGAPPFYNNLSRHVGDDETRVKKNRERFFGGLGIDQSRLVHAGQVHSAIVKIIDKPGLYSQTDGLITSEKNLFLVISVADCMPVMIYDRKNAVAANIHAGWRGTQKKIVTNAVEIMQKEYNSSPGDLSVFLGPCITKMNFEVGKEVVEMFDGKFVSKHEGRFYIDIAADNVSQLKALGIRDGQIEMSGLCTYDSIDYLHSYRRDRERSGRMFAVIGMKNS